ncbi:MAG TPA: universal stress protein [Propionibacterium sp.]|nr:universal stress protein [Propionibacterium sp.]
MTLYNNILVVVDATGNELTRARVTEFVKLNGRSVHLVYLAPEYMVGETLVSMPVSKHADEMQQYIDRLHAEGVEVRGEIMSSNWFGRGDAVLELAHSVSADLIILNTEQGGQRAKAQLAAIVARNSPKIAILIARSTAP